MRQPRFVPEVGGEYVAQLIVNDGTLDSTPDTAMIAVTAANQPPVINSTPDTTATVGQLYSYQVTAIDPNMGDVLTYSLPTRPEGMTIGAATGLIAWTPTTSQAGGHSVRVAVRDQGGLTDEQGFTITLAGAPPTNQAPQVNAGADQTITLPATANLAGTVSDDGLPDPPGAFTVAWSQVSGPGTVTFDTPNASTTTATFSVNGTYVLRLTANDSTLTGAGDVTITVNPAGGGGGNLPPDPSTVAPTVDPTVATTIFAATEFLYTGSNPIQTGVAPGTIDPKHAAVLRGRVLDRAGQPISGVTLTILNHPEFGQTLSRADGWFDMAVNGGGYLTLNYQRNGYLPAQRQANVPWQNYVVLEDMVLITSDVQAKLVDLTNTTEIQVARGSQVSDQSGARQATLLIPPGTQAQVYNPDGTTRSVSSLTLRASEFTVGANGPKAMPGPLTPNVAYTYALELSADEATTKLNGKDVLFNQPVPFYVDNFLNFPAGIDAPVGYYDTDRGAWVPDQSGRVIQILSITNGRANLDVTGSGQPADADALAALGITDAEREKLASLYSAAKSLWRVQLTHLSFWDINWLWGPPDDATPPNGGDPDNENPPGCTMCPCRDGENTVSSSVIGCESQTLGESIPLVGASLSLNYRSSLVPGRVSARTLTIPLSGATVPASLKRIDLTVEVAGRRFEQSFPAQASQTTTFTWDGLNAYNRRLFYQQPVTVTVQYAYDGVYQQTGRFGYWGNGARIEGSLTRQEVYFPRTHQVSMTVPDLKKAAVAGWSLDVHHVYDPIGKVLYQGDGARRSAENFQNIITLVAGDDDNFIGGYDGDGVPATQTRLAAPLGVAVAPDGSVLIADWGDHRVRRVGPDGIITTFAGTGVPGYSGDGGPATQAMLSRPRSVAVASDGSVLIADVGNERVRQIRPDGIITSIAGTGVPFIWASADGTGNGGPATQALLRPWGITIASDGNVLIADPANHQIRRISAPLPGLSFGITDIASTDGRLLYRFGATGRHISTLDTLTGATLYAFAYDGAGRLSGITDADGNVTAIERNGDGNPTATVAPFGQRTTLTVNGNGWLASVTNPAGEAYQMQYTADGLLTRFTDPRNNASQFVYDRLGRLQNDANAAGGSQTLARTELEDGYTVIRTTALNRSTA